VFIWLMFFQGFEGLVSRVVGAGSGCTKKKDGTRHWLVLGCVAQAKRKNSLKG